MEENKTKKSGFAVAGLVLGIVAIVFSFIPFINGLSYIMGAFSFNIWNCFFSSKS